jgi:hypothetical protein
LLPSGNIDEVKLVIFNFDAQEVISDFNVLGPIMEFGVSGNGHRRLVVHEKCRCGARSQAEFAEESFKPYHFFGGMGTSDVFSLRA